MAAPGKRRRRPRQAPPSKKSRPKKKQSGRSASPAPDAAPPVMPDTPASPAALTPTVARKHLHAAWKAGQLLNQAAFHLRQAWLLANGVELPEAEKAFDELALAVRELVESTADRDSLQEAVVREKTAFRQTYGSEHHHQELDDADQDLERTDRPRDEVCAQLLARVNLGIETLRGAIEAKLAESQVQLLRMAERVDQFARPPDIYREMFSPGEDIPLAAPIPDAWTRVLPQSTDSGRTSDQRRFLPDKPCASTGRMPESHWFRELRQRWNELGLPEGLFTEQCQTLLERGARSAEHAVQLLSEAVSLELDETFSASGNVRERPSWDAESGLLKLGAETIRNVPLRAINLRSVLDAWPVRIDSPFPAGSSQLPDTLETLNKGLSQLKFHGDGSGEGITWSLQSE
jgi:hypothetical protein